MPWCCLQAGSLLAAATSFTDSGAWAASSVVRVTHLTPRPCKYPSTFLRLLRVYRCVTEEGRVWIYHRGTFQPLGDGIQWHNSPPLLWSKVFWGTKHSVHHHEVQASQEKAPFCAFTLLPHPTLLLSHSCFLGVQSSIKCWLRSFILGSIF